MVITLRDKGSGGGKAVLPHVLAEARVSWERGVDRVGLAQGEQGAKCERDNKKLHVGGDDDDDDDVK